MQADVSKVEAATEYRWAKKGLILLSLPSLLALSLTPAYAASSSIEQVTIYQGLASVTRALPVKGNGEQTLVFSCLSPYIDKDSVSVQAVTGVNLGEVSIETLSGEQAAQCQYEGDANVQSQQAALAKINAELEAANLAKAYLQNLTKVSQISTEGTVANNARDIETQAVSINKRIWDIKQRQARAQAALNQSMAGSSTSTQNRVTQVSVRTASRKPAAVKLHYQVRGAGWQPTYQARLDTNTEQLSITASAIIAQQTGENWQNVPVVLSSVNPNQRTTGQLPNVARLSLYEKEPASRARVASSMMEPSSIVVSERSSSDDREGSAPMMAPLPSFSVSRQNKNGIIEYRLPQRVSLPSDGRHVRTVIDEQSGRSTLWIRSTPSVEQTAYWYASAPFLTPAWADGALQLYR
ncbi:MAG: mucoidy inhibitor MuiA family protein, partial [Psychrobacter celer]